MPHTRLDKTAASGSNKVQLWSERFRQFEKSSMTVAQFCQSVGCSIPTFYQWRRKLLVQTPSASSARSSTVRSRPAESFLEVCTVPRLAITIQLRSGIVLSVPIEAIDALPSILERVA